MMIKIRKVHPDAVIPKYAHGAGQDAGADLCAIEEVILQPNVPTLVRTGLSIELPEFYEAQVRPRSGLALKHGITVLNAPGTIDPSYRGEICVILLWCGHRPNMHRYYRFDGDPLDIPVKDGASYVPFPRDAVSSIGHGTPYYRIAPGDRIAQLVIARFEAAEWCESEELSETVRAGAGFGSTGNG